MQIDFPFQYFTYFQSETSIETPIIPKNISKINININEYEYNKNKNILIPFNIKKSNNGKFDSLDEAMIFIAEHCKNFHNDFTRSLAKQYIQFCYIFNPLNGNYEKLEIQWKKNLEISFKKVFNTFNLNKFI